LKTKFGKNKKQISFYGDYSEMISRNIGVLRVSEQKKLFGLSVAIAGTGGIGGLLSERLTRLGIGDLRISDPGFFEKSNRNRQYASGSHSESKKKTIEIKKELLQINPEIRITSDTKGIRTQNEADAFIEGASIVIDAMDYGLFRQSIYLQRAARKKGLYYLFASAIGFGTMVVIFSPDGLTLEEYNGLPKDADFDALPKILLSSEKVCPTLPAYMIEFLGQRNYKRMIEGKMPVSTNSIGVGLSSIVAANEIINIFLKRKPIIHAPNYIHIDLMENKYLIYKVVSSQKKKMAQAKRT
jgi:tRNA threonylcarbamoyladenosine dehydratase